MSSEPSTPHEDAKPHFIPRSAELDELASLLPLLGVELGDNRVFNVWGEKGVGKSSFISEFRESERMRKEKVLWIQPTRDEPLDDIPEFIRACAKTIRYPSNPDNEKKISEQLESVQRGKVNPIVSDDSILITRSSIAKQKKAYINQAAASSVGRTENVRDDFEINVGLGESKANNHAEGFLDALPLKSLGTDLTIIYIEHYDRLSVTVMDWLRDYVFPAATNGAYRRSLVFLLESQDPLRFAYPLENWGDWSNLTEDFQLPPLNESDTLKTARALVTDPARASFLAHGSLGYPADLQASAKQVAALDLKPARAFLETLDKVDQLKIAALSLPKIVQADEISSLFGQEASSIFDWAKELPTDLIARSSNGKSLNFDEGLRCEAISRFADIPKFQSCAKAWRPAGRLSRNVPSRNERSKLLLLAGLLWIDTQLCNALFKDQANKILPFVTDSKSIFKRKQNRYCISSHLRDDLLKTALSMEHPGVGIVFKKASKLWEERKTEIESQISQIESQIEDRGQELKELSHKQTETIAQIRIQDRATNESDTPNKGPGLLSKILHRGEGDSHSPDSLRKLNKSLSAQIQEKEGEVDTLKAELHSAQDALKHPYVPATLQ
ncbi:hypothetical protein QEH56_17885 [Pelagicoccus enzymogenes]|uniref:hypothetical protein n=1 Tax=Pelagicoccus enzymogenes TaxID=2773457 RepID=UPI00280CC4DB|nr:hypothetical protein [Pelagicoccus enzymogenes]MDQ8200040.1 hypothetical protein [Pelagicoccus enzymogenes]